MSTSHWVLGSVFVMVSGLSPARAQSPLEKVLDQDDSISSPSIVPLQDGKCRLSMQGDGNIVMERDGTLMWSSGSAGRAGNYFAIMQADGNLVVYRGKRADGLCPTNAVYSTHSSRSRPGPYFLAIHEDCRLGVYRGTLRDEDNDIEEEIWTNVKSALATGERLYKGEMLRNEEVGAFLILQHDGNLALYGGTDWANRSAKAYWAAGSSSAASDSFLKVRKDGRLVLMGEDRGHDGEVLWQMPFSASGDYAIGFGFVPDFVPVAKKSPCRLRMVDHLNQNDVVLELKDIDGTQFVATDRIGTGRGWPGREWSVNVWRAGFNGAIYTDAGVPDVNEEELLTGHWMNETEQLDFYSVPGYGCSEFDVALLRFLIMEWFYFG